MDSIVASMNRRRNPSNRQASEKSDAMPNEARRAPTSEPVSRRTSQPAALACDTSSSRCLMPEKVDWPGNANSPGDAEPAPARLSVAAVRSIRRPGVITGSRVTVVPARLANSPMPLTELWLSCVRRMRRWGPNG